ncbi:MAG: YncE family protein [Anaerolineae bacterium]|nr:YncE family protein [Anaerolineae bacterium]
MRLSPRLSLFLTLAWTLVLFGGWALLSEMTSEAAPPAYDPGLEFKVLGHIPVGDDPRGIAVVGDKVYVANHDDDTISVINATTLTVTQVISAGISNPCSMAYNPNNGYLYVTNRPDSGNGTVAVISPTTGLTVTNPIGVEEKPTGIAYNPHDHCMYVAMNYASGDVLVISGTSVIDTVDDSSHNFFWPAHIAVKEASNLLYVTNESSVSVINGSTREVTKSIPLGLQDLWGIAVNQSTGYVYAAPTSSGDQLGVINPDDTYTVTEKLVPGAALRMVAVDPSQNLVFVTQDDTNTTGSSSSHDDPPTPQMEKVFVYDPETGDWIDELEITVQQDPERGIAFDPVRHRLYVSNRRSDTVTVIQTIRKVYLPVVMKSFS